MYNLNQYSKEIIELALKATKNSLRNDYLGICANIRVANLNQFTDASDCHKISMIAYVITQETIAVCKELHVFSGCNTYCLSPKAPKEPCSEEEAVRAFGATVNMWDKNTQYGRNRCAVYNRLVKNFKRAYLAKI